MNYTLSTSLALSLAFGLAAQAQAVSYSLGAAADYNVFVLQDYDLYNSDVEGKLAVGGTLKADTFGVGSKLRGDGHGAALVTGNFEATNGKVYGDALYSGTADVATNVGFEFRDQADQIIRRGDLKPGNLLDFGAIGQSLKALAQSIYDDTVSLFQAPVVKTEYGNTFVTVASQATSVFYEQYQNGTTTKVTLTGTDADLNVFNLGSDWLSSIRTLTFEVPDTSKVIVNVEGTQIDLGGFGIYFDDRDCNPQNGSDALHLWCRARSQNILFSFNQATNINLSQVGFMGSILAPNAHIDFNNGHINGTLIAESLAGTGESHLYLFNDVRPPALPKTTGTVPEPSLLIGLAFLGLGLSRFKQPAD